MKVNRDDVLTYLRELEERNGGYYGTDLMNLAEELDITWRGLKKILIRGERRGRSGKSPCLQAGDESAALPLPT